MKARYIAYLIWMVIALLGVVCWMVPDGGWMIGKWNLKWPTLAEVLEEDKTIHGDSLDIDSLMRNDSLLAEVDSIPIIRNDSAKITNDSIRKDTTTTTPISNNKTTDTRAYLSAFYKALDSIANKPVRVVHYGDSQIEEDRITNVLRERWQKAYGGGGPGLLPLHQTIPTRTIRQYLSMNNVVQTTQGGPKRYLVYGLRSMRLDTDDYGVMGQVAMMDSSLVKGSEALTMHIEPMNKKLKPHNYFNRVRLLADSIDGYVQVGDTTLTVRPNNITPLPDSTTNCDIYLHGRGAVYGVSLESDKGVIVDNIPMRGCSGNIFTRMDSTMLSEYFAETNTRLIIMQFGGNMIPQTENPSTISGYVKTMRQQVRYMRACAPHASILFIGPSDMSTLVDGEMMTYPLIPYMDRLLAKMAQEEQIGYWSMYKAMGGKNSMVRWVEIGLAGSDYVHFTHAGANKVGRMLGEWIEKGR